MSRRSNCINGISKVCKSNLERRIAILVIDDVINALATKKEGIIPIWKKEFYDIIMEHFPEITDVNGGNNCCDKANRLFISFHKSMLGMALDVLCSGDQSELNSYSGLSKASFKFDTEADALRASSFIKMKFPNAVQVGIGMVPNGTDCKCSTNSLELDDGHVICSKCHKRIALDKTIMCTPLVERPVMHPMFKDVFTMKDVNKAIRSIPGVVEPASVNEMDTLVNILGRVGGGYISAMDKKLYIYSGDSEKIIDAIAEERIKRNHVNAEAIVKFDTEESKLFMITPSNDAEAKILKQYTTLVCRIKKPNLDVKEASTLQETLFELYCDTLVDNSDYNPGDKEWMRYHYKSCVTNQFFNDLSDAYFSDPNLLSLCPIAARNRIAFNSFMTCMEECDSIKFGDNADGGFKRFIDLDRMGILDAGMCDNFFYHFLSAESTLYSNHKDALDFMHMFTTIRAK